MDKKFTNRYKELFENFAEDPPSGAWEFISLELERDKVEKRRKLVPVVLLLVAVSVIFSTGIYFSWIQSSSNHPYSSASFINSGLPSFYSGVTTHPPVSASTDLVIAHATGSSLSANGAHSKNIVSVFSGLYPESFFTRNDNEGTEVNPGEQVLSRSSKQAVPDHSGKKEIPGHLARIIDSRGDVQQKNDHPEDILPVPPLAAFKVKKEKKFLFGLTLNYNNVWIVNSNLHSARNKSSLDYLEPVYTTTYAFTAGYQLKNRKTFLSEFLFNNSLSQKYTTYNGGHVQKYELSLDYAQFNALIAFNGLGKTFGKFRAHSVFFSGVHAGYLVSATQKIDSDASSVYGDYRKVNFGLITGGGYALTWNNRVTMMLSARCNFGLTNVYAGNDFVPKEFNKTFNEVVSGGVSLFYHF